MKQLMKVIGGSLALLGAAMFVAALMLNASGAPEMMVNSDRLPVPSDEPYVNPGLILGALVLHLTSVIALVGGIILIDRSGNIDGPAGGRQRSGLDPR